MLTGSSGEATVVIGGQWGDEGKGRIIDILAQKSDVIARFQGGNNAGHSLHFDGKSLVLHLIPCGIVHQGKIAVIGNGVVLDPVVLFHEIANLEKEGFLVSGDNLKISRSLHIILPIHKNIDQLREQNASLHIGTTKRGIGPCYEDKAARFGIRAQDLLSPTHLDTKLRRVLAHHELKEHELSDLCSELLYYGNKLKPFLCDTGEFLHQELKNGSRVLFEGAQGSLLDIDHGTYPFVTSSNCVAAQAATGSGIGPKWLKEVLLVSKAYCTRVGDGPFFTELHGELDEKIRAQGHEYGATTQRPRRCGWLDLAALKYAVRINGATGLVLTKIDVLTGLNSIKVGMAYEDENRSKLTFQEALELYEQGGLIRPLYKEFAGVLEMPRNIKSLVDLPSSFQSLCSFIEEELSIPIVMISFGKERGQELWLKP